MSLFSFLVFSFILVTVQSKVRDVNFGWRLPQDGPISGRIVGGNEADENHRKGAALVFVYDTEHNDYFGICTGSIIGKRFVLSSAHCFESFFGINGVGWAKYGIIPSSKYATTQEARSNGMWASRIWIHKKFKGTNPNFDVALVELRLPIKPERYRQIYISKPPADKSKVVAVGYGVLNEKREESKVVMMTDVVFRRFDWCKKFEKVLPLLPSGKRMLCAVSTNWPKGETDTCYGDSGGPLYLKETDDKLFQFGITSFSTSGCASYGGIPWYIKVSKYKWEIYQVRMGRTTVFKSVQGDLSEY